jgi:allantoinase
VSWPNAPSVVRGQRVVTGHGIGPASVHLDAGRIVRIAGYDDVGSPGQDVLDAGHLLVLPGLVDTHVHVNEPGRTEWEGFATATAAAAAGGVTTLLDMPLNSIPATTNVRALEKKRKSAIGQCRVDVGFLGGVVPGNAKQLKGLWDAGVFGFKCFFVPSGVEEFRNVTAADLELAMSELAGLSAVLMVHAELPEPIERAMDALRDRDPRNYATYLASRPAEAETSAIRLIVELARRHRARVHIVHVSAAGSLDVLRQARASGVSISAETCPHYLAIDDAGIADGATEFKCAPPIRDSANRDALWSGLQDGTLDFVVSDHSPCPPRLKRKDSGNFFEAWGGIASLELAQAVVWTEMRRRDIDVGQLATWMAAAPAKLVGIDGQKGVIARGADADFALIDRAAPFVVDADALHQRHKMTPYDRRELFGAVQATYLRGELVFADGQLVGKARGRLLSRTT